MTTVSMLLAAGLLVLANHGQAQVTYDDGIISGNGDDDLFQLLSYSRRSVGEANATMADPFFQTMPMLYSGVEDGLLEGPTWGAYWTQNSYGTAMTTLPFLGDLGFKGMKESQNWWFNNMADGTNAYAGGAQGWAPDGCGCDDGEPSGCNYKQGDGNVPIHDWTLEETLSGVVMQSELLLISRNMSAIAEFLPLSLRTSNLIEGRRDAATGMQTFLSGPSSNLLAPSFGGWQLENGRHAWSYMTGISVTYSAALMKLVELCKMAGDAALESLYAARLALNIKGLNHYLAPTGDYFVRSVDPNGTLHGVVGQAKHGYFEASPNHDAVAFRVADDALSAKIVAKIKSLGTLIRPNIFILPNTDATGKPSVSGAGGVGYDDMACGNGQQCGGIFAFGTWVNGGVWTTTEGRWLLAAARLGDIEPARQSVRQMMKLFATTWRMDNPLVNFGLAPYQPGEEINLTVDNFASAGGLLRGLFEYLYSSTTLTLIPHLPDNVTAYEQNFGVRWGPYRIFLSTSGVRSSGIASLTINGAPAPAGHAFNATAATLSFASLPTASAASLAAVGSSVTTASTRVDLKISFKTAGKKKAPTPAVTTPPPAPPPPLPSGLIHHFSAASLAASSRDQEPVTSWPNSVAGAPPVSFPCPNVSGMHKVGAPRFSANSGGAGGPGVVFDGATNVLCANESAASLPADKTFVAVFKSGNAPAQFCVVVGGIGGGYDGIATSPVTGPNTGAQLDIDWVGSTDQERSNPADISDKRVIASIAYDGNNPSSYLNGCGESQDAYASAPSPGGVIVGARSDPGMAYGRFFNGTINEIMVFDRVLTAAERIAVETELATRWSVQYKNASTCASVECDDGVISASGPPAAMVAHMKAFVAATQSEPTQSTLVRTMAIASLNYLASARARCKGLNNGSIPQLRSVGADRASVLQLATTAASVAAGVTNHVQNTLTRLSSTDPVAAQLVKIWNSTQMA